MQNNDLIEFIDEDDVVNDVAKTNIPAKKWSLLVVDDEIDIHQATKFALFGMQLLGREIHIESAFSAAEAKAILLQRHFDCILLDVVMETGSAGLELVEFIRNEVKDHLVRIILRTGQPGLAPEMEVIEKYDIHDYKCKSDLTITQLCITLVTAFRSFEQIQTLDKTRQDLERVLAAANDLLQKKAVRQFAQATLLEIAHLLNIKNEGIFCVIANDRNFQKSRILAGSGQFEPLYAQTLSTLNSPTHLNNIQRSVAQQLSEFHEDYLNLYIRTPYGNELIVHLLTEKHTTELDRKLLELFKIDIAIGFDTASMFEKVECLSSVGALMNFPNKCAVIQKLDQYIKRHDQLAVILMDVDDFQAINWGFGYAFGDKILHKTAEFLQNIFPNSSSLGRISVDVYCLTLVNAPIEDIKKCLQTLKNFLHDPIIVDDKHIALSMTVGVALFPEHDTTAEKLIQKSETALKYAKTWCQGSHQFFDQDMESSLIQRLNIISELNKSIENEDLRLYYKPKIDKERGVIKGIQVMVHWQRSDGLALPGSFTAAIANSGLLIVISEWILREACKQQCYWRDTMRMNLPIIVNISGRQFLDDFFLERLESVIKHSGIDPAFLELEVSEKMQNDSNAIHDAINFARKSGITISLNDPDFEPAAVPSQSRPELDESLLTQSKNNILIELIINLAHQLGLGVIAKNDESGSSNIAHFKGSAGRQIAHNDLDLIHYDEASKTLTIQALQSNGQPYQVDFQKQHDHFVLTSSTASKVSFQSSVQDNEGNGFLTLPMVMIQNQYYQAILKKVGNFIYILIELTDLGPVNNELENSQSPSLKKRS